MVYIREKKRTEQLNLRVTPEEKDAIRAAAEENNITVTELMVTATFDKIKDEARGFKGTLRRIREVENI